MIKMDFTTDPKSGKRYDNTGKLIHEYMISTGPNMTGELLYIPKDGRAGIKFDKIKNTFKTKKSIKTIKLVEMMVEMKIPLTLEHANILCYSLDEL